MNQPRIFISAVTSELASTRELVAKVLERLGYDPVRQDIFGTEPGDLRQMLRDQIDSCVGLIHLVGMGYGAEPVTPDPTIGRVSYTQYEFLYAREQKKTTWLLFVEDGCTRDRPVEQLDLPREPDQPDPAGYQSERRQLQMAWRERLKRDGHLRHTAQSDIELQLKVELLKDEFARLRRRFLRWMVGVSAALVLIAGGVFWLKWGQQQQNEVLQNTNQTQQTLLTNVDAAAEAQRKAAEKAAADAKAAKDAADKAAADLAAIKAKQAEQEKITAAKIRAQLIESSEAAQTRELELADKEPSSDKREELRDAARAAHQARLSRIDDLATSFAEIEQRSDTTDEFREMTRILTTETVNAAEKALAYAEKHSADRFERVRVGKLAQQQKNRAILQTDLKAASTAAAIGQPELARKKFEQILAPDVEPNWPEALNPYCWFLFDQSIQAEQHGTLAAALVDAQRCLELAERQAGLAPLPAGSERTLSAACDQMGDILVKRGQPGDAEQALLHFTRSLEVADKLLTQNPDSAEAARDVSISLNKLGGFLASRGQPGDAEQALLHFTRSLEVRERQLTQNPDSAAFARDVMVSHYKLGELSVSQSEYAAAIPHFQNGIAVLDRMLEKQLNVEVTQREKATLKRRVQFCEVAQLATGDWETLLKIDTSELPQLLSFRATLLAKQGRIAEVAQAGAKLRELEPKTDGNLYDAACAYALCAGLVVKDKSPPSEAELAEQKPYIELALACLKEAIAAGYDNFDHMRQDTDLTPLHRLPDFEALFPKEETK